MKPFFLFLFVCLVPKVFFAQSFEGEIVYQVNYTSKILHVSDAQITNAMGDRQDYFVQDGNYLSQLNGTVFKWQLYHQAENRIYDKMANSQAILWINGRSNKDSVLSSSMNFGVTTILGYSCDELILNCRNGVQKYYFSSKLAVDPQPYGGHLYGNWYAYLSKARALPLKITVETMQFNYSAVAVSVKPGHLDPAIFDLPRGVALAPSPEN